MKRLTRLLQMQRQTVRLNLMVMDVYLSLSPWPSTKNFTLPLRVCLGLVFGQKSMQVMDHKFYSVHLGPLITPPVLMIVSCIAIVINQVKQDSGVVIVVLANSAQFVNIISNRINM